jgi:DNA-binding NtrC family response regulator
MIRGRTTSDSNAIPGNHKQAVVACADPAIREALISVLSECGLQPVMSPTLDGARELLAHEETAMVFSQPRFKEGSFKELLRAADGSKFRIPVVVCSEFYDKDLYIEAMAMGAFDDLAFPYRREEVAWVVNNALNWARRFGGHATQRGAT